jgi:hypothetical protein
MKTAIITGASSGLGREYLIALTELCPEIEEFWLIARRESRLTELSDEMPQVKCFILPLDLSDKESLSAYKQMLAKKEPEVMLLINNAGFGRLGQAEEIPLTTQTDMIALNCSALTAVTLLTVPYMKKGSFIIQVCSIAAFCPTPRMTVYSSTKAYILSFSKGLRSELKEKGINMLAACPGPMDTEFMAVANIEGRSRLFGMLPRCDVRRVARKSIIKAKKGRAVYTDRLVYKLYRVLTKLLPHNLTMRRL